MPYVEEGRRRALCSDGAGPENPGSPTNPGELNYVLTMVILDYVDQFPGLSYQVINDISGALTECLAEFRRRVVRPYEETKAYINGDVYEPLLRGLAPQLQTMIDDEQRARQS